MVEKRYVSNQIKYLTLNCDVFSKMPSQGKKEQPEAHCACLDLRDRPICLGRLSSIFKIWAMYETESTHIILDYIKNEPLKIDLLTESTWVKWPFRSLIRCKDELDAPSTTSQIVYDRLKLFNRAALVSTEPSAGNWKKLWPSQAESEPLATMKEHD